MKQDTLDGPTGRSNLGSRVFSMEDQWQFCRLSGDSNPIHMDPVAARRSIGGQCVVHGVHGLMWALDMLRSKCPDIPIRLRARFIKPIYLDERVDCLWDVHARQLSLAHAGTVLTSAKLEFGDIVPADAWHLPQAEVLSQPLSPSFAEILTLPARPLILRGDRALASAMFPRLCAAYGPGRVGEFAHLSSIVGMEVPGLNSLFLSMRVEFTHVADSNPEFKVTAVDERFGTIKISVRGSSLSGDIDALYRSPPIDGAAMEVLAREVATREFAGVNALVVGGSRGLGEATAKLIGCGGGRSTITYSVGVDEAMRVRADIAAFGGQCEVAQFTAPTGDLNSLDLRTFNQIYYFPTPKIFGKRGADYDPDLAQRFSAVYVTGFQDLVNTMICAGGRANLLYPSTIAIEEPIAELREYVDAKLQGETICQELAKAHGIRIEYPRIPRVETDQTTSLLKVPASSPADIMLPLIRRLTGPSFPGT